MGPTEQPSGRKRRGRRRADAGGVPVERASRKAYLLKPEHLDLIRELDRLFPDLAPVVDFAGMAPGAESVDLVSSQLAGVLERRFEQPLFMAFCHLNSERVIDAIQRQIDDEALPFDAQVVLADLYYEWFDRWFRRRRDPAKESGAGARASVSAAAETTTPDERATDAGDVYGRLATDAARLVRERAEQIRALSMPLPGMPFPQVEPGTPTVDRTEVLVTSHGCRIKADELKRWIAHALLSLPARPRLLLHLREQRGLTTVEIAARLGISRFEVLLQTHRAALDLDAKIVELLERFYGRQFSTADEEPEDEPPHSRRAGGEGGAESTGGPARAKEGGRILSIRRDPRGRILQLRPPHAGTTEDPSRVEPEPDPKGPSQ